MSSPQRSCYDSVHHNLIHIHPPSTHTPLTRTPTLNAGNLTGRLPCSLPLSAEPNSLLHSNHQPIAPCPNHIHRPPITFTSQSQTHQQLCLYYIVASSPNQHRSHLAIHSPSIMSISPLTHHAIRHISTTAQAQSYAPLLHHDPAVHHHQTS